MTRVIAVFAVLMSLSAASSAALRAAQATGSAIEGTWTARYAGKSGQQQDTSRIYLQLSYDQSNMGQTWPASSLPGLNLDSDGNGTGTVVVAGEARVAAVDADPLADEQYQAKYHDYAVSIGMGDEYLAAFSTRLKVSVDKVWTTPSAQ